MTKESFEARRARKEEENFKEAFDELVTLIDRAYADLNSLVTTVTESQMTYIEKYNAIYKPASSMTYIWRHKFDVFDENGELKPIIY